MYTVLWYSATMMVQDSVAAKWFLFLTFFDTDLYRVTRWVTRWVTSRQLQRRTRSTTRWRWGAWWCHHGGQKNWSLKHRRCLRCKMGASKSVVLLRCSDIKVIWANAKTPALLNMYWTDIGLWKLMEIVKNTRWPSQISDTPFQGYVIVFL